ncbi:Protein of unknown function [Faunimonas pinastri]|uniref:DUF3253 domain-containing protein n=1 Tax=Faunimonas pinastri TaxID=1855383 RepID=A0A1H9QJN3_9HYPH|nr:DUF3253 domain-containing protein [Faunimonas pinastri]SER60638.1 Protein of unknown function [Faunimonas pinastri]
MSFDRDTLRTAILQALNERGPGRTLAPMDIALQLAGPNEKAWSELMTPLRREAVLLAHEGRVVILRKGRPVDPDDFKGVYRLALPPESD